MSLTKKKKVIIAAVTAAALIIAILAISLPLYFVYRSKGPFVGTVTDDSGAAVENVMVTDGKNVVKTDADGKFKLDGYYNSNFVTITLPSGYNSDDFYIPVNSKRKSYDFKMTKIDADYSNVHTFLQISDSEINGLTEDGQEERADKWVSHVKSVVEETNPAFIIHTGDICYEDGLKKHIKIMNSENMGVPVRYIIGNHDYIKGKGGERIFESIYGPVWYSFDVGNVHYVVTPFQVGADDPSRYNKDDRWRWLENDLKLVSPDKKVVIFNHTTPPSDDYVIKYGGKKLDLKEHNLIAWIFGHYHYNYIEEPQEGIVNISTARPDAGGIDSSPAGTRQINIDADGKLTSELHYYDFDEPLVASSDIENMIWTNEDIDGNVLFADTVVNGDSVFIGTNDDSYPMVCGVYSINAVTGKTNWAYRTKNSIKNNIVYYEGKILAQDADGVVYCLNADTGKLIWKYKADLGRSLGTSSGITADDGLVYAGSPLVTTALNIETGEVAWSTPLSRGENSPAEYVIAGNKLIVSAHWGDLVALDKKTGKKLWTTTDKYIRFRSSTPVVVDDNTLLVADDVMIMLVNLSNGKITFQESYTFKTGEKDTDVENYHFSSSSKPYVKDGMAFIATKQKGIVAFDIASKTLKWTLDTGESLMFTAPYSGKGDHGVESSFIELDGCIVFGANDGYVYKVDMSDGSIKKKINVGAPIFGKAALHDGKVIVSDFSGRVIKLEI